MIQKFYAKSDGTFAGSIAHLADDEATPDGLIEVPKPPKHPTDIWNSDTQAWIDNMDVLRSDAKKRVSEFAETIGQSLIGNVPETEQKGWPAKEAAARAHLAGDASVEDTGLLSQEAGVTGETISDLANSIIAKANAFRMAVGLISGIRRKTEAAIDAAPDEAAISIILDAARTEAGTALAGLAGVE